MARRSDPAPGAAALARRALAEDRAAHDATTRAVLPRPVVATAEVTAQAPGILSGVGVASAIARAARVRVTAARAEGSPVRPGTVVLRLRGDVRRILAAERSLLNVLMHASGVATATARTVEALRGSRPPVEVWGTRKTLPGLRDLEKAAIAHGGGRPNRRDLSDALLVKSTHLAFVPLEDAVRRARRRARGRPVQVEVRSRSEAIRAARAGAPALLIDNASPREARAIVRALATAGLRRGRWVEVSGGITPENARRYGAVGADAVSLGALTHSARAVPFHLVVRPSPGRLRRRAG